jgi:hypothetical protein
MKLMESECYKEIININLKKNTKTEDKKLQ